MSFFRVSLECEAARHVGCGTRAKPVLREIERSPGVREAWLSRDGSVLAVAWERSARDSKQILRALGRRGIAGVALEGREHRLAGDRFDDSAWYRSMQMEELSAQEAQVIAERLVFRLAQNVSLEAAMAERLRAHLEHACVRVLGHASAISVETRRRQIAAALVDAGGDVLDPSALAAWRAVVALGHRPLPGEN